LRKKIPNFARWFNFVRSTGPFISVLGQLELCGKTGFELPVQAEVKTEDVPKKEA
jgi:hypothetical protein